ncbi:MAG: hypothetical protein JW993_06840 [Sedimentisphaerales bacterium]|nr:hypothetical protein [Sedimentisphaerales bacterium]
MTRSNGRRRTFVLSAALAVFCLIGVAGAARTDNDSLNMVPSDSLFCVRINNLDAALGQVDMFLVGLFPLNVSMQVKGQLGQMVGSADAKGINTAGSFTIFGPLPDNPDPSRFGILVPVSDYQQFVSGNPNVSAADAAGISKIGPGDEKILSVVQVGNYALAAHVGDDQGLAAAKKALSNNSTGLAGNLDAAELRRANSAPVWAYGNIQLAGKMFGPMLQAQLAKTKDMMEQMDGQGQMQMGSAAGVIKMYSTMLDTLMKEAKYASLTLEPSGNKIGVGFVVAAVPGMGMADMLKGGAAKSENKLLGYLDNGAAMYLTASADSPCWEKISEAYINLLPSLMGGNLPTADVEKLKQLATEATAAVGGPIAVEAFAKPQSKPPFEARYVATLKDPSKLYEIIETTSKMMSSGPLANLYKSMGVDFSFDLQRKAATYKDIAIDEIKVKIVATDANAPQGQMIAAMYGGGFNVQMAPVNNLLVYAVGQDPGPAVRELIDKVKSPSPSQVPSEIQAALQLIPGADKADFFMTYNIVRVMQLVSAFVPIPIPQANVPSQSAVAIAGNVGDGKMKLDFAVPKQHVTEVMGLVMQMQMQQRQQQRQMQENNGGEG